jgi:Dolichyl-phosphate-mannose-protein mannosyltransferase
MSVNLNAGAGSDRVPLVHSATTEGHPVIGYASPGAAKQLSERNDAWFYLDVILGSLLAIGLCAAYLYFLWPYTPLADANNNVNGYLVTGKLIAQQGHGGVTPEHPLEFVGWMWNMADVTNDTPGGGTFYSKYPLGVPLIVAAMYGVLPQEQWATSVHYLNPVMMALGMLGVFAVARQLMNSFASLVAMSVCALSPIVLMLSTDARSHATAVFFVTWGVAAALWFAKSGRLWVGVISGLLLGYAVIVRYTEGLMVLPLLFACVLAMCRVKGLWRAMVVVAVPMLAWAVFPTIQVAYNQWHFSEFTGYDATKESTAFNAVDFSRKWTDGVNSLYNTGAYFMLPLGVAGFLVMLRWRLAGGLMLLLWFVPGFLVYMSYYWGQQMVLWDFLRFFATLFAPVFIAGVYLLDRATKVEVESGLWAMIGTIAVKVLTIGAVAGWTSYVAVNSSIGPLQRNRDMGDNLLSTTQWINQTLKIPDAAIVFGDSQRLLNHLQFARNFRKLYGGEWVIDPKDRVVPPIRTQSDSDANPIQPERRAHTEKHLVALGNDARRDEARKLIGKALDRNDEVWVILSPEMARSFRTRVLAGSGLKWENFSHSEPIERQGEGRRNPMANAMAGGKDARPRTWQAIKIFRDPPITPETTQPPTQPSTQPTTTTSPSS